MTALPTKPITNYLNTNDKDLQFILAKAKQLENINRKVNLLLDRTLALHCRVANIKENQLIMIAENGSIATQIRYQSLELIKKFKNDDELKHIDSILCKVRPQFIQGKEEKEDMCNKIPCLSKETSKIIKAIANGIKDPKLKEVMEKIANHTEDQK